MIRACYRCHQRPVRRKGYRFVTIDCHCIPGLKRFETIKVWNDAVKQAILFGGFWQVRKFGPGKPSHDTEAILA